MIAVYPNVCAPLSLLRSIHASHIPPVKCLTLLTSTNKRCQVYWKPDENILLRAEASLLEKNNRHDTEAAAAETWSSLELKIREAFSFISGTPQDRISRDTTIYKIGLDSISAIQIAGRLRKQGINLTAGDIMESPSCSQLASAVQSQNSTPVKNSPAFDLEAFDHRHRAPILTAFHIHDTDVLAVRPCTGSTVRNDKSIPAVRRRAVLEPHLLLIGRRHECGSHV